MKTKLSTDKENIVKELDRFVSKWEQVKFNSISGTLAGSSLDALATHLMEFNKINKEWCSIKNSIEGMK